MRRLTLLFVSLLVVVVAAVVLDQVTWKPVVIPLPDGGSLTFAGISRGVKAAPFKVMVDTPADLDGNAWQHSREWPVTRWQERVFRLTPGSLRRHLPKTWSPRPYYSEFLPYPEMMKWQISGAFDFAHWTLTWVDKNGVEAEGHLSGFNEHQDGYPFHFHATFPPCHSPRVTARIRHFMNDKPISQWPLIAEAEMENPSLLPLPTTPAQALPASVTRDGITVTLQSLVVDPNVPEEYERVIARLTTTDSSSGKPLEQWWPRVAYSDARHAPDQWADQSSRTNPDGTFSLTARTCFWTDGPWQVRVGLRPPDSEPPAPEVLHFKRVELPAATPGSKREVSDRYGTLDGMTMALTLVEYAKDSDGRWYFAFVRPQLMRDGILTIQFTDDTGRKWYETGTDGESGTGTGIVTGYYMAVPEGEGPPPKFVDIEITLRKIEYKIFEFLVNPEFKPSTP
ncbi:hypothetical protein AYO49_04760 [Verrucomicrobiaceae bacterium SCGC AG-212-N21]|nr:hypothetical protein AYO49_04760 [Verrucomicrobiaceae bacterium SCGC AG-212-N21]